MRIAAPRLHRLILPSQLIPSLLNGKSSRIYFPLRIHRPDIHRCTRHPRSAWCVGNVCRAENRRCTPVPGHFGRPGDIYYVQESWYHLDSCLFDPKGEFLYKADYPNRPKARQKKSDPQSPERQRGIRLGGLGSKPIQWRPPLYMPREHSRIFFRVERIGLTPITLDAPSDVEVSLAGFLDRFDFRAHFLYLYRKILSGQSRPRAWEIDFTIIPRPAEWPNWRSNGRKAISENRPANSKQES